MKKLFSYLFAASMLALVMTGCSSSRTAEQNLDPSEFENMPKRSSKKVLPKIPTGDCELKIPYDINAQAGTSMELNVILSYYGYKPLEIKEWYMFDPYNFEVRYRRLSADRINDKKTPFKVYSVKPPKGSDVNRSGLILNRDNQAMLTLQLPFIGELNPGEKALFEVYVYTSLRTFKLRSNRMLIRTR